MPRIERISDDPAIPQFSLRLARTLREPIEHATAGFASIRDYAGTKGLDIGRHGAIILARKIGSSAHIAVLKEIQLQEDYEDGDFAENDQGEEDQQATESVIPFDAVREIAIHMGLTSRAAEQNQEGIVKTMELVAGSGTPIREIYLALESCPLALSTLLDEFASLNIHLAYPVVKQFFKELIEGLAWIHGEGIMHRDITPSNLLVTKERKLKLADFGESRVCPTLQSGRAEVGADQPVKYRMTQRRTTIWWRAPEVCLGSEIYDASIDMWAAGCVLGEMLLMEPILQGEDDMQMLDLTAGLIGPPCAAEMDFLKSAGPIDYDAWQENSLSGHKQKIGNLKLKFERHGGLETVNMLASLLRWDARTRPKAKDMLMGFNAERVIDTSHAKHADEDRGLSNPSVVAAWWHKETGIDQSNHATEMLLPQLLQLNE